MTGLSPMPLKLVRGDAVDVEIVHLCFRMDFPIGKAHAGDLLEDGNRGIHGLLADGSFKWGFLGDVFGATVGATG